jgi:hypothetical protein
MPARKPQRARRRPVPSSSVSALSTPTAGAKRLRTSTQNKLNQGEPVEYITDNLPPGPEAEEARARRFRRLTEDELKQCKPSEGSFLEFLSLTYPVTESERRFNELFAEEAKARASETRSAKRSAKKRRSKTRSVKKSRAKRSPSKRPTSRD